MHKLRRLLGVLLAAALALAHASCGDPETGVTSSGCGFGLVPIWVAKPSSMLAGEMWISTATFGPSDFYKVCIPPGSKKSNLVSSRDGTRMIDWITERAAPPYLKAIGSIRDHRFAVAEFWIDKDDPCWYRTTIEECHAAQKAAGYTGPK